MARLRDSWPTSLPAAQQPRNPQSESIARSPYYTCLGLDPFATADQIRAAYHRGAKQCHPDLDPSPWAQARFQAINEAYQTLSNPSRRAAYDSLRWAGAVGDRKTRLVPVRWR